MFRLSAATRITIGLVCSMLGILIAANFLKLLPNEERVTLESRAKFVESLALATTHSVQAADTQRLSATLQAIVDRNKDLISVMIRSSSGNTVASAGPHNEHWPKVTLGYSTSELMHVDLQTGANGEKCRLEVCFAPLRGTGLLSNIGSHMTQLLLFCGPVAFFAFRWFLTMVLKNIDPSHAVPRRVREALDILSEGLMIVGTNRRILLANDAMEKMHPMTGEFIGKRASDLRFLPSSEQQSKVMPWITSLDDKVTVENKMLALEDADGVLRTLRVNCTPLVGNDGKQRGVMVTFDDVTVLEKNKRELKLAKDDAEAANKAKSDFLANMSHEIRNPMNAIIGFTDILRRGFAENEDTRREYLNTVHASGNHLLGLINDILDLSKIESGRMEMEICDCQPHRLMDEVVSVMKMKADERHLDLKWAVEGTIPATIQSDPTRLRQILMNLVGNAVKFTEQGSVSLTASFDQHSDSIRFWIKDTGIGMTPEQCSKIFEEFVQADSSVTRRFGGTGLGLAISKRLAEGLGGQISVQSVLKKGTTFCCGISTGAVDGIAMLDQTAAADELRHDQDPANAAGNLISFKPSRVLVTDDTPANRQLVGLVLRKAGLIVEEAEHGQDALNKVAEQDYDLLLMDMQMPVMDGFTATCRLREAGMKTPIIALTANVMQSDRERCEEAGCDDFLTKPINIDEVLAKLAEYLPLAPPNVNLEFTKPAADATAAPTVEVAAPAIESPVLRPAEETADRPAERSSGDVLPQLDRVFDELDAMLKRTIAPQDADGVANSDNAILPAPVKNSVDSRENISTKAAVELADAAPDPDVPAHTLPAVEDPPKLNRRRLIQSTLPTEIPEFREIVEQFVIALPDILDEMEAAVRQEDYDGLTQAAHKLKGTGGTVGFGDFTNPAQRLQQLGEAQMINGAEELVQELRDIADCIVLEPSTGIGVT